MSLVSHARHTFGEAAAPAGVRRRREPPALVRRSRILYVSGTPLVPSKLGPARRNHHMLEQLSRFYDVAAITVGGPQDRELLAAAFGDRIRQLTVVPSHVGPPLKFVRKAWRTALGKCDFLPVLEPELQRACRALRFSQPYDAIVLSSLLLCSLHLPAHVPVVADTHNAEFDIHRRTAAVADDILRRWYSARQAPSTRADERRCGIRARLVLATSERDRDLFQSELGIRHVAVVPNGIDLREFTPAGPSIAPVILFTGLLSYYPNQQGVRWFLDQVFPRVLEQVPNARVVVAGAAPPQWLLSRRSARVEVTGEVTDMCPYIRSAAAVIAPLMIGGGTRVKILEAQAMARPVVSTTIGAEGLLQRPGDTLLIADDADTFGRQLVRVLTTPPEAHALALRGRAHVVGLFDWDRIGDRLNQLLGMRLGLLGWSGGDRAHRLSSVSDLPALRAS